MNQLFLFLGAGVISYLASIMPGPLNMLVFKTTIDKGEKSAFSVAIGGVIPEIIYCTFCIYLYGWPWFQQNIIWMRLSVPVCLLIMAYNSFKQKKTEEITFKHQNFFLLGFVVALSNFLLPLFWFSTIVYLSGLLNISTFSVFDSIIAGTGAAFGALFLQRHYILLAKKAHVFISKNGKDSNKIIGGLFILIAMIELAKIIIHLYP